MSGRGLTCITRSQRILQCVRHSYRPQVRTVTCFNLQNTEDKGKRKLFNNFSEFQIHDLKVKASLFHSSSTHYQSTTEDVSYEELKEKLKSGDIQLIDVRQPEELIEVGKIDGAINIPLLNVKAALEAPPSEFKDAFGVDKPHPNDDNIVFQCKSGRRSFFAMSVAHELGFKKARNYIGGYDEWTERES
ncbi:unnamed protein product [Owenia fusiformis]|uniref:Uncharacterized protein n=1 Tax=Owenia fusiformis TaxID=6347 RepID=A0A8J1UAB0_OWEFU|nr:unnamed protein product [Owenia fusiformis]